MKRFIRSVTGCYPLVAPGIIDSVLALYYRFAH